MRLSIIRRGKIIVKMKPFVVGYDKLPIDSYLHISVRENNVGATLTFPNN